MNKFFISRWIIKGFRKNRKVEDTVCTAVDSRITVALYDWVQENGFCRQCRMEEAAEELGTSKEQLSWYFNRTKTGGFVKWRTNLRIMYAMEILDKHPHLPFSSVGEFVGIPDKSNFRKEFRHIVGMSPQEWRRSRLEKLGH